MGADVGSGFQASPLLGCWAYILDFETLSPHNDAPEVVATEKGAAWGSARSSSSVVLTRLKPYSLATFEQQSGILSA